MALSDSASDVVDVQRVDASSSMAPSLGDPRLPKDVWPDIVSHLSHESIENAMFVCRYFRTLAQPYFFRMLAIKPFNVENRFLLSCSSRDEEDSSWIWRKLKFYSSPTIARHVQFCRISPFRRLDGYSIPESHDRDCGLAIVDAIFELLPQFTNLKEIDLDSVDLTEENIKQLSRIHHFDTVSITDCNMTATPIRLAVQRVVLQSHFALPRGNSSLQLLSSLLQPAVTECLCLNDGAAVAAFFDLASRLPPLRHLHTLYINISCTDVTSFVSLLPQLPALREITVDKARGGSYPYSSPLPPSTLPLLESYEGPLHLAEYFCQGRPIRHLKLTGMSTADDIFRHLQNLRSSSTGLESLGFHVGVVDKPLLQRLFDKRVGFPQIKALEITFDMIDHKASLSAANQAPLDSKKNHSRRC